MSNAKDEFQAQIISLLPNLRAFARSLCGNPDQADDHVQETIIKAWRNRDSFAPGSNMRAWLFTILRNGYISELRKKRNEVEDATGEISASVGVHAPQSGHMDFVDFEKALSSLPADQREALLLIGAEGFSYEEAALMCGCAVGTMKSRVNRARGRLSELLGISGASEFGPDESMMPISRSNIA